MSIIERLTALFAPDDCLGCNREGSLLCVDCQPQLLPPVGYCFGCYEPVTGVACNECLQSAGLMRLNVACDYSSTAKLLVACLKFRGNQSAARLMAEGMIARLGPLPIDGLLVSIPATTQHIRQRGFDQAALITRELSRLTGLPRAYLLRRSGQQHQLGTDRRTRLRQLNSSISIRNQRPVRGAQIILVDDVLTTGASLQVAARVLNKSGARSIEALIFAQSVS